MHTLRFFSDTKSEEKNNSALRFLTKRWKSKPQHHSEHARRDNVCVAHARQTKICAALEHVGVAGCYDYGGVDGCACFYATVGELGAGLLGPICWKPEITLLGRNEQHRQQPSFSACTGLVLYSGSSRLRPPSARTRGTLPQQNSAPLASSR